MTRSDETEKARARDSLPRLLAGKDRLSRFEKEQIFEQVADGLGPGRSRGRRLGLFAFVAACGAAAVFALVVPTNDHDGFSPRGGGQPDFEIYCTTGGERAPCRSGGKLLFELSPTPELHYFAAYSRRSDATIIWYFPADETSQSYDARSTELGVATTAFAIGPEHAAGQYAVLGLFSDRPLSRAEVRARAEASRSLLQRRMTVEE